MSEYPSSLEAQVRAILQQATEPLTGDQILERLPAGLCAVAKNPRQKLKAILARPEVGHASRGRYVYLPSRITGSLFRLSLTGREVEDGYLQCGPDLAFALWFHLIDWGRIPSGASAACELPDGRHSEFTVERMARDRRCGWSSVPLVAAGVELREWLREERIAAGDSLRARIADAEEPVCHITLERLAQRDREETARRNQEFAEAAAHVLRNEVRGKPLSLYDLTGWLLARGLYLESCPPDPLEVVLQSDLRFSRDSRGRVALATKWEWVRDREPVLPPEMLESLVALLTGRPEDTPVLSETERRLLEGVDPIEELAPWLEATGYRVVDLGEETEDAADEAETDARGQQVYRLRIALRHRPSVQRTLEVRGEDTLVDLDEAIRHAFGHDTFDHLSEFYVRTGAGRRDEGLGTINPMGEIEGEDMELAELELEPGDELGYVYDFGDWIAHTITVEAILSPEPEATYPREVGRSVGRRGRRTRRGKDADE